MPLADYIEGRLAGLRSLLEAPDVVAIQIATRAETEMIAAKLLGAATDDEDEPSLLIGWSGAFEHAEQFCRAIEQTVAAEMDIAREALDGEQLAFRLPAAVRDDPTIAIEVRLVEYLEKIAAACHNHVRQIVVALDVDARDPSAWAATRERLLANTGSGRLKWVTFATKAEPRLVPHHRFRSVNAGVDDELARLLDTPGARLSTFLANAASPAAIASRLQRRTFGKCMRWVTVEVPPQSCDSALTFFAGCARALGRMFAAMPHAAPLVEEVEEQTLYAEPELAFVDFCDRLAVSVLKPGVGLVVVVHPPTHAHADDYEAMLDRLARAASSLSVKFVAFEPQNAKPRAAALHRVEPIEVELGPQQMKAGIEAKLAKPDLPDRERLQLTLALSGVRLGEEEPEQALDLSTRALELAETSTEPVDACIAWYQHGNTLYHLCAFAKAEEAYAESAHRALEHAQHGLAAMALTGAGHTFFCREDPDQALKIYGAARAMFAKLGLLQHEIYVLTWIGQTNVMGQRYPEARDRFDEALALCGKIDLLYADTVKGSKAELFHRLAYLYSLAGRPDLERRYQAQATELGMTAAPCMHP